MHFEPYSAKYLAAVRAKEVLDAPGLELEPQGERRRSEQRASLWRPRLAQLFRRAANLLEPQLEPQPGQVVGR